MCVFFVFFFKQKTAYEIRPCDWSSDVCSSDLKQGGGLAGHNGLRSLADALGTQDFLRVRAGIGRPERGDPRPIADWLLQPFEVGTDVDALVRDAADCAQAVIREGVDAAMREWN